MTPTRPRGRPRASALDERILHATRESLSRDGYAALAMEAVAAAAGVGKQTLYRRWPRKPLLVFDAVFGGAADAAAILPDTGSLAGDLAAVVEAQQRMYADGQTLPLLRGLLADCLADPGLLEQFRARLVRPRLDVLATAAARAAARGELRAEVSARFVAEAVGGAMLAHVVVYGGTGERFGPMLAGVVSRGAR
ncbi:MAG: TetR/AcrR family transcriptional regulator C-terminal ligand-binding domain-containing protein [Dactylosporangium sp.]|nr:TetR/AcrR family transcriptional regulator C-terminal ligand-binding domain-containing protein [Dactylosporangium sp.]NNJ59829.1 TetR/AcrR family transcriptional regulator C-terminal ligand-binding domain-containing protein [Dactylosporangium sp.]